MTGQTSPIGLLYRYVLVVLFFQIGGLDLFLSALFHSFSAFPVDAILPSYLFAQGSPFWQMTITILATFAALALQLSAPSFMAILMAETFLGIANRLAPQVQISFLGMALKSLAGLTLLWTSWFFVLQQLGKHTTAWFQQLDRLMLSP
jgi:type III secretion protein T